MNTYVFEAKIMVEAWTEQQAKEIAEIFSRREIVTPVNGYNVLVTLSENKT